MHKAFFFLFWYYILKETEQDVSYNMDGFILNILKICFDIAKSHHTHQILNLQIWNFKNFRLKKKSL